MRTLTVLWLHSPDDGEGDLLSVVEHGLSDAFRDFCSEAFNVRMPLEYPPLKLTTVHSPEELPDALFIGGDPSRGMTEGGDDACLFMVDDSFCDYRLQRPVLYQGREWRRDCAESV